MRTTLLPAGHVLLVAALAAAGEAWAQKPPPPASRWDQDLTHGQRAGRLPLSARTTRAGGAVLGETEPNDVASQANRIALGDQATGEVNPSGDVDVFVVAVGAGTALELDVDAADLGSPLDAVLCLYRYDPAQDTTMYLACNDDYGGSLDSRLRYTIPVAGDYYAELSGYGGQGGSGYFYTLNVRVRATGPGDPTTVVASGFEAPAGLAFDEQGNLFVTDVVAGLLARVASDGQVTVIATGISWPVHVAFDGFGELLVTSDDGTVYKVGADGSKTPFLTGMGFPCWVAIAPDGNIWVADYEQYKIHVFDPFGAPLPSIDAANTAGPFFLAFAPSGQLYFSDFDAIYRLVGGQPEVVLTGYVVEGFAFDVGGNLYVANEFEQVVVRYAPDGVVLADPFAVSGFFRPVNVAFGRDPDGSTNARLFVADWDGTILEVNPAGVAASGWPVGTSLLRLASQGPRPGVMGAAYADTLSVTDPTVAPSWTIRSGTLPAGISLDPVTGILSGVPEAVGAFAVRVRAQAGTRFGEATYTISITAPALTLSDVADLMLGVEGALTADEVRYLDLAGNRNGRFDVGDFRAYVLRTGAAAARAAPAASNGRQP